MKGYGLALSQYCITVGLLCVLLYLYGFFPIKKSSDVFSSEHDLPTSLQDVRFNKEKLYNGSASKTVLMVIDGVRVDFITQQNMPYTAEVLRRGGGCQMTARVAAPTVTLPRIKAIVTGSVSGFIDVVLNLGTVELISDNIVRQFTKSKRAVFYGDDTWVKLFPRQFKRNDGTSSFFVNDYTEVDDNVTRHLDRELSMSDWDLMILHYLGLDHIGHIQGPKSSLIQPKLREMDGVIKQLHNHLLKQEQGVLVVCGDHGMKDSGSHGGVSLPEVLVPVIVLGLPCVTESTQEILQVDLAATLSVLWGSPIPADNIGVVTLPLLSQLTVSQRLYALLHNALQLSGNFLRNGGDTTHEGYQKFEEAKSAHYEWLVNSSSSHSQVEKLYHQSLLKMSRFLSEVLANYNMPAMVAAIGILLQVLCIMAVRQEITVRPNLTVILVCVVSVVFVAVVLSSVVQSYLLTCGLIFIFNIIVIHRQLQQTPFLFKGFRIRHTVSSWNQAIIAVGTVLFCISLFSSSLIEEEHQLWYFLWATVIVLRLREAPLQWLAVLASHRVLRRLNSTGDKWAHLPDTSDWLIQAEQKPLLSVVCGVSLLCVVWCCTKVHYSRSSVFLYVCTASLIYQHKAASLQVSLLPWQISSITLARVCWCLLLVVLLLSRSVLRSLLVCWLLAVCLLLRSYNTVLVPVLYLVSRTVSATSSNVLPLWLGSVFYFYQGNSNSLASVDLAAGYVGLEDYNVSVVGILLIVHTYSMPVLAYLVHVHSIVEKTRYWETQLSTSVAVMVFLQLLHVFVCLLVITIQRYHLFVWTVFAPKLLYVAAQTLVCFVLVSITNICMFYTKITKVSFHV
ncbi:GPI ethanolamine phosphate transferase 2-like [Macrosteles quadrilineatus]|uniref:GPI ethanolamine phosphate transferase 2-like n=1 Tax=Macrosteles quadrilineatus TaxID=74068 RepID=UPI0023E271D9|nr:GPI ethanolamine phosphate transferase 2-like [Macrosteles quadrilineatus]